MIIHQARFRNMDTRWIDLRALNFCLMANRKARNATKSLKNAHQPAKSRRRDLGFPAMTGGYPEKIGIFSCAHEKIRERRATTNAAPDYRSVEFDPPLGSCDSNRPISVHRFVHKHL